MRFDKLNESFNRVYGINEVLKGVSQKTKLKSLLENKIDELQTKNGYAITKASLLKEYVNGINECVDKVFPGKTYKDITKCGVYNHLTTNPWQPETVVESIIDNLNEDLIVEDIELSKEEIAEFIKGAIEDLIAGKGTNSRLVLDNDLCLYVGWSAGYGKEIRDDVIQDKEDPDWAIVAGIKERNDADWADFDFLNFAYNENGDIWDSSVSIRPDEDYEGLASFFIKEYDGIRNGLDNGELKLEALDVAVHSDTIEKGIDAIANNASDIGGAAATIIPLLADNENEKKCCENIYDKGFDKDRENVLDFPNGEYFYVDVEDGKIFAGSATNTGIIHEFELDYDENDSLDGNLERLWDLMVEQKPELLGEALNEEKYDLVGQDGNAYALMGYTARALKNEGLGDLVKEMQERAMSGDYWNLIAVCDEYIQKANEAAGEDTYESLTEEKFKKFEALWYNTPDMKGDYITQEFETKEDLLKFYNEHKDDKDKFGWWLTERNEDWEVVDDIIVDESCVKEGAEGKKVPGKEFVIFRTETPNEIVAKRSTRVEAEFAARRIGRSGGDVSFEEVPKGRFKVGDSFEGPFNADWELESLENEPIKKPKRKPYVDMSDGTEITRVYDDGRVSIIDRNGKETFRESALNEEPVYGLEPNFDGRKSFYGKAQVETDGDTQTLYSYGTPVVRIAGGKVELLPRWNESQTTLRHVREFLRQNGFEIGSKSDMAKMYDATNEDLSKEILYNSPIKKGEVIRKDGHSELCKNEIKGLYSVYNNGYFVSNFEAGSDKEAVKKFLGI